MTPLQTLQYYFTFPFVRYALIVGVLIALCASLFGVTLVLKRFSFIGDGLSHVAFGALAVAAVFNLTDEMLLVLPVTVIAAVLLLHSGQSAKLQGDAAIAVLSVGTLAIGYLLMNLFSTSTNLSGDVCSTQHPLRLHLHPHPDPGRGLALRGAVGGGHRPVCGVLQPDFCRHL